MLKIAWYLTSIFTVFLILSNNPNNMTNTSINNSIINFRSNKIWVQKLIVFSVVLFLIFTILLINLSLA